MLASEATSQAHAQRMDRMNGQRARCSPQSMAHRGRGCYQESQRLRARDTTVLKGKLRSKTKQQQPFINKALLRFETGRKLAPCTPPARQRMELLRAQQCEGSSTSMGADRRVTIRKSEKSEKSEKPRIGDFRLFRLFLSQATQKV